MPRAGESYQSPIDEESENENEILLEPTGQQRSRLSSVFSAAFSHVSNFIIDTALKGYVNGSNESADEDFDIEAQSPEQENTHPNNQPKVDDDAQISVDGGLNCRESRKNSYPSFGVGQREYVIPPKRDNDHDSSMNGAGEDYSSEEPCDQKEPGTQSPNQSVPETSTQYYMGGVGRRENIYDSGPDIPPSSPATPFSQRSSAYSMGGVGRKESASSDMPSTSPVTPSFRRKSEYPSEGLGRKERASHSYRCFPTRSASSAAESSYPTYGVGRKERASHSFRCFESASSSSENTSSYPTEGVGRKERVSHSARRFSSTSPSPEYPREGSSRKNNVHASFVFTQPRDSLRKQAEARRSELRSEKEAKIEARAKAKVVEMQERSRREEEERRIRENLLGCAEETIDKWTDNGLHSGNLRILLSTLHSVIYTGSIWKIVTPTELKDAAKVKSSYRKAILQVHPDKVRSKHITPEQEVIAELIYRQLRHAYNIFTRDLD